MKTPRISLVCSLVAILLASAALLALPNPGIADSGRVVMLRDIPYAENAFVREEVKSECRLSTRISDYIVQANRGGRQIITVDELPDGADASILDIEIVDATETGNAFSGRHKSVTLKGELRVKGKVVGTFRARRSTTGGVWGGFKSNCSFLARCAKTLGSDVAKWVQNPSMGANLGR